MKAKVPRIAVLGSINMDLVANCADLPKPGQTVSASGFAEIPGGKGANQAVAACRAGADVAMVGRLGDDGFADRLRFNLTGNEVDCRHVATTNSTASGVAMIAVAGSGENQIIVVPGANGLITPDDVGEAAETIRQADVLLLQLEIPTDTVLAGIEVAKAAGTRVILDPAPVVTPLPDALLDVDLLCPNTSEAAELIGQPIETAEDIEAAAREFHRRGAKAVAITLGETGTAIYDGQRFEVVSSIPIDAVDTTAAGDAFAGALAVQWAENSDLFAAVRFGNAAGALAATRHGAQPSLPNRPQVEEMIRVKNDI
ncbi:MAG: ribokinase [Planctomycetota bacterium]